MGIGKGLIRTMFDWLSKNKIDLNLSWYTREGKKYLKPLVESLRKEHTSITVKDSDWSDEPDEIPD
jgi:hypothetical protein